MNLIFGFACSLAAAIFVSPWLGALLLLATAMMVEFE